VPSALARVASLTGGILQTVEHAVPIVKAATGPSLTETLSQVVDVKVDNVKIADVKIDAQVTTHIAPEIGLRGSVKVDSPAADLSLGSSAEVGQGHVAGGAVVTVNVSGGGNAAKVNLGLAAGANSDAGHSGSGNPNEGVAASEASSNAPAGKATSAVPLSGASVEVDKAREAAAALDFAFLIESTNLALVRTSPDQGVNITAGDQSETPETDLAAQGAELARDCAPFDFSALKDSFARFRDQLESYGVDSATWLGIPPWVILALTCAALSGEIARRNLRQCRRNPVANVVFWTALSV
jgi:hypothetical protein